MFKIILKYKVSLAVGIVWMFHLAAIIGITLGHLDWFIKKTPLNLVLCLLLFFLVYPLNKKKQWIALLLFFASGMFAEWLGITYGILFGSYSYGDNFGPKLDGVPYLIGSYWALLTFVTASISDYFKIPVGLKIVVSASLMVMLDYFMEHSAAQFGFWTFEGNLAPFENYISWLILALLFQTALRFFKTTGNRFFSLQLFLAQLVFFAYFYFKG